MSQIVHAFATLRALLPTAIWLLPSSPHASTQVLRVVSPIAQGVSCCGEAERAQGGARG